MFSLKGQKWKKQFADAVEAYNSRAINNFCIISTNATFATDNFQIILSRFRRNFCFVVDEAHNFGAEKLSKTLLPQIPYRLALSATIDRHGDPEGTARLYEYFGEKCAEYTLGEAIANHKLTPYYY